MQKNTSSKKIVFSIEEASILRKFTVLFLLMSIIPTSVLYYFYIQIKQHGRLLISESNFNLTLIIVVAGVIVGYIAMRSVLEKVIGLTEANKKALETILGPEKIKNLNSEGENEIEILTNSFTQVIDELENSVTALQEAKKKLHSVMTKVGQGITTMQNIDSFLELIVETTTDALSGRVGVLIIKDDKKDFYSAKTIYGRSISKSMKWRFSIPQDKPLGQKIYEKEPFVVNECPPELNILKEKNIFPASTPFICAPLNIHDDTVGCIFVSGPEIKYVFEEDEKSLLANLATQTAVAIENSRLNQDIEKTYFETISALALAVDAKDKYSRGHLDRVSEFCVLLANKLGLNDKQKRTLRAAARLHDLGKIGIPDDVLKKEGPLTDQEWELMRKHPEIGESIIRPIGSLEHLCDIIRHHHEKLNGSGYPDGLRDDDVTLLVRVTTIADIFDALTSDRSYRQKLDNDKAIEILRSMKNELDQNLVEEFIEAVKNKPNI
ncbi:MAG: HD-GYP domain-containing protein [Candidatus Omnitrophica bacterium]|nr:HD-GYP domain-containing protein [Candidatus Omnitrophota bacterium]